MNNPYHCFESLETTFWVKFFDVDPGSGMEKIWIRDKYPGSATLDIFKLHRMFRGPCCFLDKNCVEIRDQGLSFDLMYVAGN